jgi:predicted amino acid racemase
MKRNIYILHANGALGVTKVDYDDDTPGDIIIAAGGSQVDSAMQCFIEETNLDPADITTVQATNEYRRITIPIAKVGQMAEQTVEQFFRELWGDDVYETEALSRDWD